MIRSRVRFRNLAITVLALALVLLVGMPQALVQAQTGSARISLDNATKQGDAGTDVTFVVTLTNGTPNQVTFAITASISGISQVPIIERTPIVVDANGAFQTFTITVRIPLDQAPGNYLGTITASGGSGVGTLNAPFTVIVSGATRTSTPSNTVAPSVTRSPTLTLTPGAVCRDVYEPDDNPGSANEIFINLPQPADDAKPQEGHAICPSGDEDWLFFGGLAGQVYTIDITRMALGIDLSLGLYNEAGEQLAFNDDFYNRAVGTPDPRAPGTAAPGDIRPRIQSWTAPANGRYYIQVRDASGSGGVDRIYSILLLSESYGPTPTEVPELCEDLFEQDGLPEQARLLTSNEIQLLHTLCPTGDADWIRFFGKTGKTYFIFTNTDPYRSTNPRGGAPINKETEAGADTVLVLTDRDGISVLDFNDDIPGGNTLDSQIEFTPSADGFYYVQVKNVGDIGNQFIRYDLTLRLCIPGQTDCGRPNVTPEPPTVPQGSPTVAPTDSFIVDQTPTGTVGTAQGPGGGAGYAPRQPGQLVARSPLAP